GFMDVLAFGNGLFTLWLGDGLANWTEAFETETPPGGNCEAFRAGGDIDHNGYPDFILLADEGSWPSEQNQLHLFSETTAVEALSITPVYPRGYEKFQPGSVLFVDWVSAVPDGMITLVDLAYSFTGPEGPWYSFAQDLPNNGRYQWQTPVSYSDQYFIQYTVHDTNQSFTAVSYMPFAVLGEGILGDVNLDQTVDILDIVTLVNLIINQEWTENQLSSGDINQDGQLNILDVIQILNMIING
ncbi:MAG: hypothetical protein H8D46_01570, partial [FCB group bacterium]|nr:hypothetical protein [FCB group bacterium]